MKLKPLLLVAILAALQISFIACNKLETIDSSKKVEYSLIKTDSLVDPSNILNPEDSTGQFHNAIVSDFLAVYIERYSELTNIDSVKGIVYSYLNLSVSQINTINSLESYALENNDDYDETMKGYYNSNTKVLSLYLQIKEIAVNLNFTLAEKIS